MHSNCVFRVVDNDMESPYKIVPDIFDLLYICERFCITIHMEATMLLVV